MNDDTKKTEEQADAIALSEDEWMAAIADYTGCTCDELLQLTREQIRQRVHEARAKARAVLEHWLTQNYG